MVEEGPAHAVELVDDAGVLLVHPLDLGRELGARLARRGEARLRGALLLGRRAGARSPAAGPTRCARRRCGPTPPPRAAAVPGRRRGRASSAARRLRRASASTSARRLRAPRRPPAAAASTGAGSTVSTGAGGSGGRACSASISSSSSLRLPPASAVPGSEVATGSEEGAIRLILRRPDPLHLTTLRDLRAVPAPTPPGRSRPRARPPGRRPGRRPSRGCRRLPRRAARRAASRRRGSGRWNQIAWSRLAVNTRSQSGTTGWTLSAVPSGYSSEQYANAHDCTIGSSPSDSGTRIQPSSYGSGSTRRRTSRRSKWRSVSWGGSASGAGTPAGAAIADRSTDSSGRWKLAMRFSTAPRAWYATTWRVANDPLSRTRSTS